MTVEHSNTENTTALRIYYCGREQCAPGHFWGPAIRPHYLLHVVLHGKGEFFYQEKKYELSAGDAFLIEPMQTHYYQADKEDPWEYFYNLFCRSTYSFINVNGKKSQTKVMFHDIDNYGFNVSMTSPSIQFQILNHGIYDKKYGEMSRFRFWSDKWGAMNNADKQRLSDDADERFQRNVNQVNLLP